MFEDNNLNQDLDKLTLKQLRKERKLLKKTLKREKRESENNRRILEMKLGPTDQHITLISQDAVKNINKFTEVCCSNINFNLNNTDDNFPALNDTKSKHKYEKIATTSYNINNEEQSLSKYSKMNKLTVNLSDILSNSKPIAAVTKKQFSKEKIDHYSGNSLDSSQPERYKGKRRENPKRKSHTKLKSQIIADMKKIEGNENTALNISDNLITDELNALVKDFLCDIVRFQDNLYKRDPIKGTAKRRYVVGIREVKKYLVVKKIKILIIAPNFYNIIEKGALDIVIQELISLAKDNEIPYVFALSRRKLGQITFKTNPVSCIGIFYYDGAEEKFNKILEFSRMLRKSPEVNQNNHLDSNKIDTSF